MSEDILFRSQLQKMVEDTYGIRSDEYKIATSIPNDGNNLIELVLQLSETRLVISDKNMTFITGVKLKEMHNKAKNCNATSLEFKSVSGEIYNVTKNGIEFNIPSQSFTEYSGCNSNKVLVDYLPATARLQGKNLIVTHIEGIRMFEEKNGIKTIVRKDAKYFFNLKPASVARTQ